MRRLVFLRAARKDLADILDYVTRESGSLELGSRVVARLREKCRHLASLSATVGRPRTELRADLRNHPYKNYVIFFRCSDDTLEVVNVLHASRDIDRHFNPEE